MRVAAVSRMPVAARVVTTGGCGEATRAKHWTDPAVAVVRRSPLRKALVLTATATLLLLAEVVPNWPEVLRPHVAKLPSWHRVRQ